MNQSDFNLFHDGHREVIAPKAGFQGQAVQCSSPSRPEEFQDSLEHDVWGPNTPTMTRGSSRSTSSTIIACETCGNSSNQCGCQSQSDSESVRFHVAETESSYTGSPSRSPAVLVRQIKDQPLHKFLFKVVADASGSIGNPRATRSTSLPLSYPFAVRSPEAIASRVFPSATQPNPPHDVLQSAPSIMSQDHENGTPVLNYDLSDSELSEDDEDGNGDPDNEEDDDDWSGQDANLEIVVLEALGGDLVLAANLIPILHKSFYSEFSANITKKVGPWRYDVTKCSPGTEGASSEPISSNTRSNESNPRKRQRRPGHLSHNRDADEEDEEDDDDENARNPKDLGGSPDTGGVLLRLACPFHKLDPTKYCIQHEAVEGSKKADYRSCEGPGFKSIQRLKEHLKRKHYPVQCDRCYQIFPGPDRAPCVLALVNHRQLPTPCERRQTTLKEGISDAQWANLDKKKNTKKTQASSRIEKYWEIWDTIFPGVPKPETPWYEERISRPLSLFSQESQGFSELFSRMLELQVGQQHIRFPEGLEDEMRTRVETLAQKAFSVYVGLHGLPSATNSSSSRSRQQGSLGSTFPPLSTPRTSETHHSPSASRSTAAPSQAYSMDMQSSPTSNPMMTDPRTQRANMGPPSFMVMPHIVQQNFVTNPISSSLQAQHPSHSHPSFSMQLPDSIVAYSDTSFSDSNMNPTGDEWAYNPGYDGASSTYTASNSTNTMANGGFVGMSSGSMSQSMWEQVPRQYDSRQQ